MTDYTFDFTLEDVSDEEAEHFLNAIQNLAKRRHLKFGGGGCHKVDENGECIDDEQEPGKPAQ